MYVCIFIFDLTVEGQKSSLRPMPPKKKKIPKDVFEFFNMEASEDPSDSGESKLQLPPRKRKPNSSDYGDEVILDEDIEEYPGLSTDTDFLKPLGKQGKGTGLTKESNKLVIDVEDLTPTIPSSDIIFVHSKVKGAVFRKGIHVGVADSTLYVNIWQYIRTDALSIEKESEAFKKAVMDPIRALRIAILLSIFFTIGCKYLQNLK